MTPTPQRMGLARGGGSPYAVGMDERGEVIVEIDGPGVHPTEVDAVNALEYLTAQLAAIEAAAEEIGEPFTLSSVEIRDKCMQIVCKGPAEAAVRASHRAADGMRDPEFASDDAAPVYRRANKARAALPAVYHALVIVGDDRIVIERVDAVAPPRLTEHTELRGRVVKAGGSKKHRVELRLTHPKKTIPLGVDRAMCLALGASLYKLIDAEVVVTLDKDLTPVSGRLIDYALVDETVKPREAFEALVGWMRGS